LSIRKLTIWIESWSVDGPVVAEIPGKPAFHVTQQSFRILPAVAREQRQADRLGFDVTIAHEQVAERDGVGVTHSVRTN
jgi:hypothetical protein